MIKCIDQIINLGLEGGDRGGELVGKLVGREGYRLKIGDWRIIYEINNDKIVMLVLDIDTRGGIYK